MIVQLNKVHTDLSILLDVPTSFFEKLEAATSFGDHLFPDWFDDVFGTTKKRNDGLYKKFEKLYDKYKAVSRKSRRDEIVKAYTDGIQVENLCNRVAGISAKKLSEFTEVKDEMRAVLKHLWENSLKYEEFEKKVKTDLKKFAKDFIDEHHSQICPFCGLEGYLYVDGQSRLALDHWLCKTTYSYSSVNFENLIPIGDKCNERPAKGTKNVLSLTAGNRVFYPFTKHGSIKVEITTTNTPTNPLEENGIYTINILPVNSSDQDLFDSWDSLFNINTNYKSYLTQTVLNRWRGNYIMFISQHDILNHATNIPDLKTNLLHWKGSFQPQITPGYLVYKAFIDNLLSQPDPYLYGIMEYFKRQ